MYLLKSQPKISRSKSFPRAYFSSNSGSAFTILTVSTLTVITRWIGLTMYSGSSARLGSLTILHPVELFGAMAQQIRKGREHCALPFRLDLRESL
jgi:hypothetical protein